MLPHSTFRIFAAVLPFLALCSASSPDTSNIGPRATLWDMVPECARQCVENFIESQYTPRECSPLSEIQCLCKNQTPSGLTFGEGALSCLYAVCAEQIAKSASSAVYHICTAIPGAVRETHLSLTVTTFPGPLPTTTDATTTDGSTTTETVSATSTSTLSTTSELSPKITTFHPPSSQPGLISSGTSSTTATSSSAASNEKGSHHVSPGTVIGISVASGVAGPFIIGFAVFFYRKRRRQNYGHDDSSSDFFDIGGAMAEPTGFSGPSSPRSPLGPRAQPSLSSTAVNGPEMAQQVHYFQPTSQPSPRFYASDNNAPEQPRERVRIGFAASSESERGSPSSPQNTHVEPSSNQTRLHPKPLKLGRRPVSGETLFEEDELQQGPTERRPRAIQRSNSPNVATGLPPNPRALKNGFPAQRSHRSHGQQESTQNRGTPSTPSKAKTRRRGSSASNSGNSSPDSSGSSQPTSSSNTLLATPLGTGQDRILSGASPGELDPEPHSSGLNQILARPAEIVSRPRIVRGDDIKRVQIRTSTRPPNESAAPYCPEEFWLERGRGRAPPPPGSSGHPYPSEVILGTVVYPSSPKKRPVDAPRGISPMTRNVTPSRQGEDMILQVE